MKQKDDEISCITGRRLPSRTLALAYCATVHGYTANVSRLSWRPPSLAACNIVGNSSFRKVSDHPALSHAATGAGDKAVAKSGKRGDLGRCSWKLPGSAAGMTCILYLQLSTELTTICPHHIYKADTFILSLFGKKQRTSIMSSIVEKVKDKLNLGKSSDTASSHTHTTGSKHGNVTRKHRLSSFLSMWRFCSGEDPVNAP